MSVAEVTLSLLRPADPDELLDEEAFKNDEFLPYWAQLWPSALELCEAMPTSLAGLRVVEPGCGLGIPSLLAARRGAQVTATDWAPDAIDLLVTNARRKDIELEIGRAHV